MSLAKKELHRLVDSLPARETKAVKRFIEFILARSRALDLPENRTFYTVEEASALLEFSPRRLRYLIREDVIPAYKERGRWLIKSEDLRELQTTEGRAFLSHPLAKDDLTEDEKARSVGAWDRHLAGKSVLLRDLLADCHDEPHER